MLKALKRGITMQLLELPILQTGCIYFGLQFDTLDIGALDGCEEHALILGEAGGCSLGWHGEVFGLMFGWFVAKCKWMMRDIVKGW